MRVGVATEFVRSRDIGRPPTTATPRIGDGEGDGDDEGEGDGVGSGVVSTTGSIAGGVVAAPSGEDAS